MKSKIKGYKWINAVLFQAAWITCVLAPVQYALIATSVFLAVHLYAVEDTSDEVKFILPVAAAGFAMDFAFDQLGFIEVNPLGAFPLYLLLLWVLFSSTLRWSLRFFTGSSLLAGLLGLLAPISYYAAQRLEKVTYSEPLLQSIAVHALLWAVLMLIVKHIFIKDEKCTVNA